MITQEQVRDLFEYRDGVLVNRITRSNRVVGIRAGNVSGRYRRVTICGRGYPEHHIVWLYVHGDYPKQLDHINGDAFDNRIENLRVCTTAENLRNRGRSRRNTTGYKGVSFHRLNKKFECHIGVDGKPMYLGSFNTAEEAKDCYDRTAKEWYGAFYRP